VGGISRSFVINDKEFSSVEKHKELPSFMRTNQDEFGLNINVANKMGINYYDNHEIIENDPL